MFKVMTKTGLMVQYCGIIYKTLAYTVMLYGRDIWVVTGLMLKILEGFHHRAARRIWKMTSKFVADGT